MLQLSLLISIEANTGPGLRLQVKPEDLTMKSVRDVERSSRVQNPIAEGVHC